MGRWTRYNVAVAFPFCAWCQQQHVKRRESRYCSLACRDAAAVLARPQCRHCHQPCPTRKHRYCSVRCVGAARTIIRPRCRCGVRVLRARQQFCSKYCAWIARNGPAMGAKGRARALAVNRAKYVTRLKAKLAGMTSKGEIWRAAYKCGFTACYVSWLRRVRRGDVTITRVRREWSREAA